MPLSPPASREDFKIAIICALPLEAKAVKPLFDTVYDESLDVEYRKVPSDPNAYTLGRYHVVLVHMPGPGKVFASSVASNIRMSYPRVELALVVGVCSGVPYVTDVMSTKQDVFLGDVVVSNGVVQHDLGKRISSNFVRKNTIHANLGRPSPQILAFLNKLDVGYKRLTDRLVSYLANVQECFASEYPGTEKDRLFSRQYKHKPTNCECAEDTGRHDTIFARLRASGIREPKQSVHFGLVASGDTVMMSARDRDRIAQVENVIAF